MSAVDLVGPAVMVWGIWLVLRIARPKTERRVDVARLYGHTPPVAMPARGNVPNLIDIADRQIREVEARREADRLKVAA